MGINNPAQFVQFITDGSQVYTLDPLTDGAFLKRNGNAIDSIAATIANRIKDSNNDILSSGVIADGGFLKRVGSVFQSVASTLASSIIESGTQVLTAGSITDGKFFKRSGTTFIGESIPIYSAKLSSVFNLRNHASLVDITGLSIALENSSTYIILCTVSSVVLVTTGFHHFKLIPPNSENVYTFSSSSHAAGATSSINRYSDVGNFQHGNGTCTSLILAMLTTTSAGNLKLQGYQDTVTDTDDENVAIGSFLAALKIS